MQLETTQFCALCSEMNITGTIPSDELPMFFLKPNLTLRHACLARPVQGAVLIIRKKKSLPGNFT
jgi:hypothetical protein